MTVIERYQRGDTISQIAKDEGVSTDTIRWQLSKANVLVKRRRVKCELDEQEVINLYKQDVPVRDIAKQFKCSTSPIVQILKANNVRKPNWLSRIQYKHIAVLTDKVQFSAKLHELITRSKLAEYFECGIDMIDAVIKHHDIVVVHTKRASAEKTAQWKLTKENFLHLNYTECYQLNEIEKLCNVSSGYMRRQLGQWNITPNGNPTSSREFNKIYNDAKIIQELYNKHTISEITTKFNISVDSVSKVLSLHNITKRTLSESKIYKYVEGVKSFFTQYEFVQYDPRFHTMKHHNCDHEFTINTQILSKIKYTHLSQDICPNCFPRAKQSRPERELVTFIESIYSRTIDTGNRRLIAPKELDIVLPELKIAIEFNGLYWHSEQMGKDRNYHVNKLDQCISQGYKLITIFEDEWTDNKQLVKDKLAHMLHASTSTRVFARKCVVREISPTIKNDFLTKYHIQGKDRSAIKLGLYHTDVLVAVMTFSHPNIAKGGRSARGVWELNRYATDGAYNVIGGAGKLLSHFKKTNSWVEIFSYADRRWSVGNVYTQLGFTQVSSGQPNYWYIPRGYKSRVHRFNFIKSKLISEGFDRTMTETQIMESRGYHKIWDCGSLKYVVQLS